MLVDFEEVVGSNNNTHSCFGHGPLSSVCSARSGLFSSFTTLAFLCVLNSKVVPYYPTPVFVIGVVYLLPFHALLDNPSKSTATRLLTRIHDVLSGNILAISDPLPSYWPRSQPLSKAFGILATSLLRSPNDQFIVRKHVWCFLD